MLQPFIIFGAYFNLIALTEEPVGCKYSLLHDCNNPSCDDASNDIDALGIHPEDGGYSLPSNYLFLNEGLMAQGFGSSSVCWKYLILFQD